MEDPSNKEQAANTSPKLFESDEEIPKDFEPGGSKAQKFLSTETDDELDNDGLDVNERKPSLIVELERSISVPEEENTACDTVDGQGGGEQIVASTVINHDHDCEDNISLLSIDEIHQNDEWKLQKKHIFVLSEAGKPIYTRHGSEDKLVTLMGVMQALVSFVIDNGDAIRSIETATHKFVFLVRMPLILVAVSQTNASVAQLIVHLTYMYNQIISILTSSQLLRIFKQRSNFDLRRLLGGSEKYLDSLSDSLDNDASFLLGAVRCLPLTSAIRDIISQTIVQFSSKMKTLVFAILIANNQVITLVRMKKIILHPADLHLIMNLVYSSETFKVAESWLPICLPKFDSSGFLHAHISYLDDNCPGCLILLTVDRDLFSPLQECRWKIVEKLRCYNCMEAISAAVYIDGYSVSEVGIPDLRHFLYKSKSTAQFTSPRLDPPYNSLDDWNRLFGLYQYLHHRLHNSSRKLKILFAVGEKETILGWQMTGFELYASFEPLVTKFTAVGAMNKLVRWIKKEEERLFIINTITI